MSYCSICNKKIKYEETIMMIVVGAWRDTGHLSQKFDERLRHVMHRDCYYGSEVNPLDKPS